MANKLSGLVVSFLLLLCAGCGETGRCRLTIAFPDEEARAVTRQLAIWALGVEAGGESGLCTQLSQGEVSPADGPARIDVQLELAYPLAGAPPGLEDVPVGPHVFFVEARGAPGEVLLRGCQQARVAASGTVEVRVSLAWVCRPVEEVCGNGVDDDCDGQTDEDCVECRQDADCEDGNPCTIDFCMAGTCHQNHFPDGTPCSDGDPCTLGDGCQEGTCRGNPKDCSAYDGPCALGACDPQTGVCVARPREDGTACDDGAWCTRDDACREGSCIGVDRDCDDGDPCTQDGCNEGDQRCENTRVPRPGEEGPPGDGTCANGVDDDCDGYTDEHDANCIGCTTDRDCDDGNPCTQDACAGMVCENTLLDDGTPCTDGLFCTVGDSCLAGVCGGLPRDCDQQAGPCQEGVCIEDQDRCDVRQRPDGTACDDGAWCTVGDRCTQGTCDGGERDCDDGDSCTTDACDEDNNTCRHDLVPDPGAEGLGVAGTCTNGVDDDCDSLTDLEDPDCIECDQDGDCDDGNLCTLDSCAAGVCSNQPLADGTPCDDGLWCTVDDACQAAVCTGTTRSCAGVADACHAGICDEQTDACVAEPEPDGTPCDDLAWCTVNDHCQDGACSGSARDCDDDDPCTADACSEAAGACTHELTPNPGAEGPPGHGSCGNGLDDDCDTLVDLDDPDCYDCAADAECNDNNPCTSDSCDWGVCANQPLPDGTACDDGRWCTTGDTCQAAACSGAARDCSAQTDACHQGVCDEGSEACVAQPLPEGSACDDGLYCTVGEACTAAGVCTGPRRDCSGWSDACHQGGCDDAADSCIAEQLPDGSACDDGQWCTVDDACTGGACGGVVRDCDDDDVCTLDECDEPTNQCIHTLQPDPGAEGPPGDGTCFNGGDDDCDALTDLDDPDCYNCTGDGDCDDGNPCTLDTCSLGTCHNDAAPAGTGCDDGFYCTVDDACSGGVCTGAPRDCSAWSGACNEGVCDEGAASCRAEPRPDGTACQDGLWCTVGDTCTAGSCSGPPRDCSDTDPCTLDACDEDADTCTNTWAFRPEEQDLCGDGIDQDCDGVTDGCCQGDLSYTTASTTSIGPDPWSMTAADFDEDGVVDLATVNRGDDSVSVLLGLGDGSFQEISYAVGDNPYGVAAADLDADGILDLVTANNGGNSISLLFGQGSDGCGDGTFGGRQDISFAPRSARPCQVVVGDFNADGIYDLATANWDDDSVAVLPGQGSGGQGDGTFGAPVFYGVGDTAVNPRALATADFDSDGILDLAVANWNKGKVSILAGGGANGRGDGTFSVAGRYDAGGSEVSVAAADFDADGILDLAVVSMSSNAVGILPGNGGDGRGDGTFGARTAYPTGTTPVSVQPADLDADGILDLVVADWGSSTVSVMPGNGSDGRGDGTFAARTAYGVGTNPAAAVVLDADLDGIPDLAACNNGPDTVSLLAGGGSGGRGDGSFVIAGTVATCAQPGALAAADLDADAVLDLAVVCRGDGAVQVLGGGGSGGRGDATFSGGWSGDAGTSPRGLAVADVDGDRIPDLLVASAGDGAIGVLAGQGAGGQGDAAYDPKVAYPAGTSHGVVHADLDSDAIGDLVGVDHGGTLRVRPGGGTDGVPDGTFGASSSYATGAGPSRAAIGDLNADTILDAVTADSADGTLTVLLGDGSDGVGTGMFVSGSTLTVGGEPVHPVLADLDGDGILDLAVANQANDTIDVLLGDGGGGRGDGTFTAVAPVAVGEGPVVLLAADFDEDGALDLATANAADGSVSVALGNGDGSFAPAVQHAVGGAPAGLACGHYDWDGRLDLAVSDGDGDVVVVLRGTGSCTP